MAGRGCYWVTEPGVGRVLIPGCWNRAVYGDHAECHCRHRSESMEDRIARLEHQIAELSAKVVARG